MWVIVKPIKSFDVGADLIFYDLLLIGRKAGRFSKPPHIVG